MNIDPATIILALGMVCCGISVALMVAWRLLLPLRSLLLWGIGIGCYGIGVFLLFLRPVIPAFISLLVANLLIVICYCFIWAGISLYRQERPHYRLICLILFIFVPLYCWFAWGTPDIAIRTILIRVFILTFLTGILTSYLYKRTSPFTPIEKVLAGALLLDGFFRLSVLTVQLVNIGYRAPIHSNLVAAFSAITGIVGMISLGLAMLLLALEHSAHALQDSERFTRATMDALSAHICILDEKGYIIAVNNSWNKFARENNGVLDKLSVGVNYLTLCDTAQGRDSEEAQPVANGIREVLSGTRNEFVLEYPCHSADQKRWFLCWITRFNYHDRNCLVVSHDDITSRKEKEIALLEVQGQMVHSEKMASIGQLAAGIAHEINNPMGFINSNLGTLGKYLDKYNRYIETLEQWLSEQHRQEALSMRTSLKLDYVQKDINLLLTESVDGAERVMRIVKDLKVFARSDSLEKDRADINQCLDSTINIIWNQLKFVAELVRDYHELPLVLCNAPQLNQVFMNLLMNAAHSLGEGEGIITVQTEQDGDCVLVKVSDTGCGMSEELQHRIFEPFFTTKEVGKGTGLGLSISYDIIKKHGGEITVKSEVGKGTTFTLRLPVEGQEI